MSDSKTIFQDYGRAVCRDQRVAKLLAAFKPFLFDGSECFRTINAELPGPENEIAASNIRHANLAQYRDCIPADVVLEIVTKLLDEEKLP